MNFDDIKNKHYRQLDPSEAPINEDNAIELPDEVIGDLEDIRNVFEDMASTIRAFHPDTKKELTRIFNRELMSPEDVDDITEALGDVICAASRRS